MREELKHSTSIGNKSGIEYFLSVILDNEIQTLEAISSLCSYVSSSDLNYLAALYFFDDLDIIDFHENMLSLTDYGMILKSEDASRRLLWIGKFAIDRIISDGVLRCDNIKISLDTGQIEIPVTAFPLSASVYRNFLIAINVFSVCNRKLLVNTKFEKSFEKVCANAVRKITQEELLAKLDQQQADGEKAELFVLEYENSRMLQFGKQAKRISQIDVAAGYDILSYEGKTSTEYDVFIEVKSYHGTPHFYWSDNERNTSMVLGEKYRLFLVDIDRICEEKYAPIIITNPYINLSEESWIIKPQSYYVCQI